MFSDFIDDLVDADNIDGFESDEESFESETDLNHQQQENVVQQQLENVIHQQHKNDDIISSYHRPSLLRSPSPDLLAETMRALISELSQQYTAPKQFIAPQQYTIMRPLSNQYPHQYPHFHHQYAQNNSFNQSTYQNMFPLPLQKATKRGQRICSKNKSKTN